MDAGIVRRYAARLAEHAATRGFFLLIGIAPLRSAKSARWMKEHLFGTIIPDAFVERSSRPPIPPGGPAHRDRADRGVGDHPGRRRRPRHGAGQRGGGAGVIARGAPAAAGAVKLVGPPTFGPVHPDGEIARSSTAATSSPVRDPAVTRGLDTAGPSLARRITLRLFEADGLPVSEIGNDGRGARRPRRARCVTPPRRPRRPCRPPRRQGSSRR